MALDAPTATLVAATFAGGVAFLNVLLTVWNTRRAEDRSQYRLLLQPHVVELCEAMYEIGACAKVAGQNHDVGKASSAENWLKKASIATNRLKKARLSVRFAMPSLSEGLRVMTRVGNWVAHRKREVVVRDELLESATKLRESLEDAIRTAYLSGKPPGRLSSWHVRRAATRVRKVYELDPAHEPIDELPEPDPLGPLSASTPNSSNKLNISESPSTDNTRVKPVPQKTTAG